MWQIDRRLRIVNKLMNFMNLFSRVFFDWNCPFPCLFILLHSPLPFQKLVFHFKIDLWYQIVLLFLIPFFLSFLKSKNKPKKREVILAILEGSHALAFSCAIKVTRASFLVLARDFFSQGASRAACWLCCYDNETNRSWASN